MSKLGVSKSFVHPWKIKATSPPCYLPPSHPHPQINKILYVMKSYNSCGPQEACLHDIQLV